jgi:hypothetical protein
LAVFLCQELSLVSWRLVLVDVVTLLYLLALFVVMLKLSIQIDINVLTQALLKYVTL